MSRVGVQRSSDTSFSRNSGGHGGGFPRGRSAQTASGEVTYTDIQAEMMTKKYIKKQTGR